MPKYLIYDTETSGFYKKGIETKPAKEQPWIVQMGMILTNGEKDFNRLAINIKAEGRSIDPGAEKVHGISVKDAEFGLKELQALEIFLTMFYNADIIVCHNVAFDLPMTRLALVRNGLELPAQHLKNKEAICTMKSTTNYCALPNKWLNSFKWPKLEELHQKLFGFKPLAEELHDALADCTYTKKCFFELLAREII
jgi:DNA polymerase-3 subunit alpha